MGKKAQTSGPYPPSQDLLEDIVIRFVLNAPEEERSSFERMLFLIEQAHWFYEDHHREVDTRLQTYSLRDFTALVFQSVSLLAPYASMLDPIFRQFQQYKQSVPVCGCIILSLDMQHVLLVKGWKSQSPWGFPKGKINRDEAPAACAAREVWEETGFDVTPYLDLEANIQFNFRQKEETLFIITGIDERTAMFQPQANKEISAIEWYPVDRLPDQGSGEKDSYGAMKSTGADGSKFYMVWPFVKKLRKFIKQRRRSASSGMLQQQATQQPTAASTPPVVAMAGVPTSFHQQVAPVAATPPTPPAPARPPPTDHVQARGCALEALHSFRLDGAAVLRAFDKALARAGSGRRDRRRGHAT